MATSHRVSQVLGPTLRTLREEHDISQEKLAFAAGMDRTFIGKIERGERHVTVNSVALILDALGVTWEELGARLDTAQRTKKRK